MLCMIGQVEQELRSHALPKYIFCLESSEHVKYELSFWMEYVEDWNLDEYCNSEFHKVNNFGTIHYRTKPNVNNMIKYMVDMKNIECDLFKYSYDGNEEYYPHGYIEIAEDKFDKTSRGFDKNPIWVFKNAAESHLVSKLIGLTVFDMNTVSSIDEMPEKIRADVINLDSKFDIREVTKRVMGEIVRVNFSEYPEENNTISDVTTYVFFGPSNIGKSFLAHQLSDTIVFETDTYATLPDKIDADIIVLGNKYKHDLSDIRRRVTGRLIQVEFSY